VINLAKEWDDLTVEEKIDELSHAMSAVVSMAMDLDARMRDLAIAGKNVVQASQITLNIATKNEDRVKSLERRVDALTNGTKTETIWSRN
jgi:hypothetical protein